MTEEAAAEDAAGAPEEDDREREPRARSRAVARVPRGLGRTERGAAVTLALLLALVLLLQHQLRESTSSRPEAREELATANPGRAPGGDSLRSAPTRAARSVPVVFAALSPAPSRGDLLRGRVVDTSGRPLVAAAVALGRKRSTTDDRGQFEIDRGRSSLSVSHPAAWPSTLERAALRLLGEAGRWESSTAPIAADAPGASAPSVPITLVRALRVAGRVLDAEGRPLDGARVVFSSGQRLWELAADERGEFAGGPLPVTEYEVVAIHPRAIPARRSLRPPHESPDDLRFVLDAGVPLEVTVRGENGVDVVAGAEIWTRASAAVGEEANWVQLGWTDASGRLETGRPRGPCRLRVVAPGFHATTRPVLGRGVTVRLASAPSLAGTAVDASSGLPIAPLDAVLEWRGPWGFAATDVEQNLRVEADGTFVASLPPRPGVYRVRVFGRGGREGHSRPLRVDGGASVDGILVSVARDAEIVGRVWGPSGGARVELLSLPAPGTEADSLYGVSVPAAHRVIDSRTLDAGGEFAFRGVSPGLYRLHVWIAGFREYYSAVLTPPIDRKVPIVLEEGVELRGAVRVADGSPAAGVPIILFDRTLRRSLISSGEGRYAFSDLPPGRYSLVVAPPGGLSPLRREVTLPARGRLTYNLHLR